MSVYTLHVISVVIPTLNEARTVGSVIALAKSHPKVREVIVVDDRSLDETVIKAQEAGAKVITSTKMGKGASMRDGLLVAKGEIVVYLDGDIDVYDPHTVDRLTEPILQDVADFVKSTFERSAGRVTELVAKPLLALLMPGLNKFSQPLSGMIAGRKSLLMKLNFENDYGVDVGLLIDAYMLNARIAEVSIGSIVNKSKTWTELSPMAKEVAKAILKRASRLPYSTLNELETIKIVRDQMDLAIRESVKHLKKMIVFDMDNTLLRGRFIDCMAAKYNFSETLHEIRSKEKDDVIRTKKIAQLLKGKTIAELLAVADEIPFVSDAEQIIKSLKKRGYWVGILTDSYDLIALHIQHKLGADFAVGNELEFSNSSATGEVKIPSFLMHTENSLCPHNFCKLNALLHLAQGQGVDLGNVIAVGDGKNDLCMIKHASIGVAFCSDDPMTCSVADFRITKPTFKSLLKIAR